MSELPLRNKKTLYGVAISRRKEPGDACLTLSKTINEQRILIVKTERRGFLESTCLGQFTIF